MKKIIILFSALITFGCTHSDKKTRNISSSKAETTPSIGEIIQNGTSNYFYYDDMKSHEKLVRIEEECLRRGQRLPKTSEMAAIIANKAGFKAEIADLTVTPPKWQIWKSPSQMSPSDYINAKESDWAQLYTLEEEGQIVYLYTSGRSFGNANKNGQVYYREVSRSIHEYISSVNNIKNLEPDVFLAKGKVIAKEKALTATPDIKADEFVAVGVGQSSYGNDRGSPLLAAYPFIFNISLLEPRVKSGFRNPVPLTEHFDGGHKDSDFLPSTTNLRVLVQCIK